MPLHKPWPLYAYYHTHWDREWYLPFRQYQHRLIKVVDGILEALESGALSCFALDGQCVLLEDDLAFRPDHADRMEPLIRADKLSIGPWYVMPDEFLVSGESLIRNLQIGLAISKAYGEETFTGYLPDTFGHSADIPMILRGFGIGSAMVWRGVSPPQSAFWWQSPSGDRVLAYHLSEGYFQNSFHMGADDAEKSAAFTAWRDKTAMINADTVPCLFPVGADHLGLPRTGTRDLDRLAPEAVVTTPDHFMAMLSETMQDADLTVLTGEFRHHEPAYLLPGVASSRLYLKQWNRRLEWRLTRQLEPLLAWLVLLGHSQALLPQRTFLWKTLLLNHPHDSICGCSIDAVHRENEHRFEQVDQLSSTLVRDAHHALRTALKPDTAFMAINLTDRPYSGVVAIHGHTPIGTIPPPLPAGGQLLSEETVLDDRYLEDTCVLPLSENQMQVRQSLIWVNDLPAHGVWIAPNPDPPLDTVAVSDDTLENAFLQVTVTPDGSLILKDKQAGQTYTGMHRLGRRPQQGDSYNAAPVPGSAWAWAELTDLQVLHAGPLRGVLQQTWHFPTIGLSLETVLTLDAGRACLDFETAFVNATPDHLLQACFEGCSPLTAVTAEGHFSLVTRVYDPDYRLESQMPAPPQRELLVPSGPIQRWIHFQTQTLLTEGLTEYEVDGSTLKLTLLRAFGWLSRNDTGVRGSHAGPPMETPEGQCLHRPQRFRYAWFSGSPDVDPVRTTVEVDRLYGGVYGFERRAVESDTPTAAPVRTAMVSWDNPHLLSSACLPSETGEGLELRLINLTEQPQPVTFQCRGTPVASRPVDLQGQPVSLPAAGIRPQAVQTFRLLVE